MLPSLISSLTAYDVRADVVFDGILVDTGLSDSDEDAASTGTWGRGVSSDVGNRFGWHATKWSVGTGLIWIGGVWFSSELGSFLNNIPEGHERWNPGKDDDVDWGPTGEGTDWVWGETKKGQAWKIPIRRIPPPPTEEPPPPKKKKCLLCIHSSDASTGPDCRNAGDDIGHSWISVHENVGESDQTTTTYGAYPPSFPRGNGSRGYFRPYYDNRRNYFRDWSRMWETGIGYVFCFEFECEESGKVFHILEAPFTYSDWTFTANCASYASDRFRQITGLDIDADGWLGYEHPSEVGDSIISANGLDENGEPIYESPDYPGPFEPGEGTPDGVLNGDGPVRSTPLNGPGSDQ